MLNAHAMTPQQIREAGIKALSKELGVVGMIRFMQQFELGTGDYSTDRHQWLDQYSVDDIARLAGKEKARYTPRKRVKRA